MQDNSLAVAAVHIIEMIKALMSNGVVLSMAHSIKGNPLQTIIVVSLFAPDARTGVIYFPFHDTLVYALFFLSF